MDQPSNLLPNNQHLLVPREFQPKSLNGGTRMLHVVPNVSCHILPSEPGWRFIRKGEKKEQCLLLHKDLSKMLFWAQNLEKLLH